VNVERLRILRVYEASARVGSEHRVLVDRLWPRGLRKEDVDLDEWIKDVAPSTELRRWYGHVPERFDEFARRYRLELEQEAVAPVVARLRTDARTARLVLLTATRDVEHSGAEVLRSYLEGKSE
jgi:uncharacterized protein YeaO (DUF488 family)